MTGERPKPAGGSPRPALRVLAGIVVLVVLRSALLAIENPIRSFSPGCFLRRFTGFYCPGCGGTRAFFAFLRGDIGASWRMNPLFLSGLGLGLVLAAASLALRSGRPFPQWMAKLRLSLRGGYWILAAVLVFGILRNVPCWPFTLWCPRP